MSGSPSLGCGGYGPVHSVVGAATSLTDVKLAGELRHGAEEAAFGEVGYRGAHKHSEAAGPASLVVMRSGMRRKLSPFTEPQFVSEQIERAKASVRERFEQQLCVLKRQLGYTKCALPGAEEESNGDRHAVRAVQAADGAQAIVGGRRIGASALAMSAVHDMPCAMQDVDCGADRKHVGSMTAPRHQLSSISASSSVLKPSLGRGQR